MGINLGYYMKSVMVYFIIPIVLCVSGFFGIKFYSDNQFGEPDIINGKAQFVSSCAACHGMKGLGDGPISNTLAVAPDNIYEELINPFGFKFELISSVMDGDNGQGGLMPAFRGILTEKDINDIFGYIESIN